MKLIHFVSYNCQFILTAMFLYSEGVKKLAPLAALFGPEQPQITCDTTILGKQQWAKPRSRLRQQRLPATTDQPKPRQALQQQG